MTAFSMTFRVLGVLCAVLVVRPCVARAEEPVPLDQTSPASAPATPEAGSADDIDLLDMDVPVVVSAARREQPVAVVPHAISVITAEEIRRSGARSIPDALRLVPGVDVADLGYGNAAVSPRGLHGFLSRQVLVLVDGRQIFDSFFGGTVWGSWPIALEDVERIEVIRGPAGVVWGANAVNGVINIITKNPAQQAGLTVTAGGGTQGTHREYTGYAFADEKLSLRASAEYEGSRGYGDGGTPLLRPDDRYRALRQSIYMTLAPTADDRLLISGGSAVIDSGFARTPLAGFTGEGRDGAQSNFLMGRWEHQLDRDSSLNWTFYVNDFTVNPGVKAVDYRYQQYAFQLGHKFKPAESHVFTWGFDTRADTLDQTNADPFMSTRPYVSSAIFGLYAQDEWQIAPRWMLNLGARIDYDMYGGFEPSGRAALSHQFDDGSSVYGAVARAFQMPPAGQRFLNVPFLDGVVRTTSNQDMEAEHLIAYELGYRKQFFERLDVHADLFWNEYRDLTGLGLSPGPPGLINQREDNRASAGMYGAELEAKYKFSDQLFLLSHYTYQQLAWESAELMESADYLVPPAHKFMIGPRWSPTDSLHFSAQAWWVDTVAAPDPWNPFVSKAIPPYWRLDLRAEYEFWERRAALAVGVRNLLDDHHPEGASLFLNDVEAPRMIYGELRISFK